MRIRKVKWNNHPILRDLELNFINPKTGHVCSNVIIAGENGTGKTTILETLNTFLCAGSFLPFAFVEYEAKGRVYVALPTTSVNPIGAYYDRLDVEADNIDTIASHRTFLFEQILKDDKDIRHYGCVFSRPRADYKTDTIKHTTTLDLDKDRYESDLTDNFTYLKQLLIDIQSQDYETYYSLNSENNVKGLPPVPFDQFYKQSKIYRFKNAFDNFFQNIRYDSVCNEGNSKTILFQKNNSKIPIDKLSTGEKQIVFRGAYLLKNLNQLMNAVVMVDEPELSMHPKWQSKVLDYYKQLFKDSSNNQSAQLFFTTHSPQVINSALRDSVDTKVIVLDVDVDGVIIPASVKTPGVLSDNIVSEVSYQAFGIASTDYHNALYGYIEAEGLKQGFSNTYPLVPYNRLRNGSIHQEQVSLSEKIRHIIHHPENGYNTYTEDDLKESIERMRSYILNNI